MRDRALGTLTRGRAAARRRRPSRLKPCTCAMRQTTTYLPSRRSASTTPSTPTSGSTGPADAGRSAAVDGPVQRGSPYQLPVAIEDGVVLDYAATSRYRPRPAFDGTVELSVHLSPDARSRGVGSALYGDLFALSERYGTRKYLAGLALPNDGSLAFHRRHGFVAVGTFIDYAHKWGSRSAPHGCSDESDGSLGCALMPQMRGAPVTHGPRYSSGHCPEPGTRGATRSSRKGMASGIDETLSAVTTPKESNVPPHDPAR